MTREERVANLATLLTEAKTLCQSLNEARQENKPTDEVAKIFTNLGEKVNEYTNAARTLAFEDCKATENPMLKAVTDLTYKTIAARDVQKDDGDKFPICEIDEDVVRPIDLLKLHQYCDGVGADQNWPHIAQKMNFLLTAQKAVDLGIDPKEVNDSYEMSNIARGFDMGKNPTSKTNLLKTLQTVVFAMLGEGYKAKSHDVNFLMSVYARKSRKALTVSCANQRNFCRYLAEICHRIVTDGSYTMEYTKKKA